MQVKSAKCVLMIGALTACQADSAGPELQPLSQEEMRRNDAQGPLSPHQ